MPPIFDGVLAASVSGYIPEPRITTDKAYCAVVDLRASLGHEATGGSDCHGANAKNLEIGIGRRGSCGAAKELSVPTRFRRPQGCPLSLSFVRLIRDQSVRLSPRLAAPWRDLSLLQRGLPQALLGSAW